MGTTLGAGHWLKPLLFSPHRLRLINQRLGAQTKATGLQPSQQRLGVHLNGAHMQAYRFDQELYTLLTNPALVAAVKEASGLHALRPSKFELLTTPPGGPCTP